MAFGLKRSDLRALAQAKIDDASLLLSGGRASNAYYLSGYAVELGLKACIAAQVSAETIPDKEFIKRILNHDFATLVGLAGLTTDLKEKKDADPNFATNWAVVSEWSPDARYEAVDITSAQVFFSALTDPNSGVLQWIKAHW